VGKMVWHRDMCLGKKKKKTNLSRKGRGGVSEDYCSGNKWDRGEGVKKTEIVKHTACCPAEPCAKKRRDVRGLQKSGGEDAALGEMWKSALNCNGGFILAGGPGLESRKLDGERRREERLGLGGETTEMQ